MAPVNHRTVQTPNRSVVDSEGFSYESENLRMVHLLAIYATVIACLYCLKTHQMALSNRCMNVRTHGQQST